MHGDARPVIAAAFRPFLVTLVSSSGASVRKRNRRSTTSTRDVASCMQSFREWCLLVARPFFDFLLTLCALVGKNRRGPRFCPGQGEVFDFLDKCRTGFSAARKILRERANPGRPPSPAVADVGQTRVVMPQWTLKARLAFSFFSSSHGAASFVCCLAFKFALRISSACVQYTNVCNASGTALACRALLQPVWLDKKEKYSTLNVNADWRCRSRLQY